MDLAELVVISAALVAVGLEDVRPSTVSNTVSSRFFKWPWAGTKGYLAGGIDSTPSSAGAVIFLLYVTSALALTFSIVRWLRNAYKELPAARRASTGFQARFLVLSSLSVISFASISYNMLSFLIVSYRAWSAKSISSLGPALLPSRVWQWASTNRLFYDFATSLFGSAQGYWWTRQGLLASMLCALFMSVEGKRRKLASGTLPLLRLFILNQILPASFAQSLFFLVLLLRKDSSHTLDHLLVTRPPFDPAPLVTVQQGKSAGETRELETVTFLEAFRDRVSVLLPVIPYSVLLATAPVLLFTGVAQAKENVWVIPGVLALRALLFLPYFLPKLESKAKGYETWRHALIAIAFYVSARNIASIVTQPEFLKHISIEGDYTALGESFAVKAIGRDYIVWQVVVLTWSLVSWIKTD